MQISARAKINLSLQILGKRPDGYHAIETLMVPIALADELEISLDAAAGIFFTCDDATLPCDSRNLAYRAAAAFYAEVGLSPAVRIHLQKHIPHGAGLGGGSSDAAAVLVALDRLHNTNFTCPQLETLAATLGSDVPWFIQSSPAWCRGRGEILSPHPPIPPHHILLLKPPFGIPTAWAYSQYNQHAHTPPPTEITHLNNIEIFNDFEVLRTADGVTRKITHLNNIEIFNDLEILVFKKFPMLQSIKNWLLARPEVHTAAMSGSGATIFAILDQPPSDNLLATARSHFGNTLWLHSSQI